MNAGEQYTDGEDRYEISAVDDDAVELFKVDPEAADHHDRTHPDNLVIRPSRERFEKSFDRVG